MLPDAMRAVLAALCRRTRPGAVPLADPGLLAPPALLPTFAELFRAGR